MKALLIIVIFITGVAGLFYFKGEELKVENLSKARQACIEKYNSMPQAANIISDVEGFCGCNANIKRPAKVEEIKIAGRACMDQYGKATLIQRCEDMNVSMRREDETQKGIDCGCFYNQLITLFGDEVIGQNNGADTMTKQKRDETVAKAYMACKN